VVLVPVDAFERVRLGQGNRVLGLEIALVAPEPETRNWSAWFVSYLGKFGYAVIHTAAKAKYPGKL